jgi:hypothetical protein
VRPSLDEYAPKPEPAPEPIVEPPPALDPLAELKLKLRTLTYGEFMEAISGIAGRTLEPYDDLVRSADKWAMEGA